MSVTILQGDVRETLRQISDESVNCCVTSPPYYGLRSYGVPPSVWGGDPACEHEWKENRWYREGGGGAKRSGEAFSEPGPGNAERLRVARWHEDCSCVHCGAWQGCLGLEPDYRQYVAHMVQVFDEVRRVLRKDGTLWLNLGDSYTSQGGPQVDGTKQCVGSQAGAWNGKSRRPTVGLKPKDLMLIPHRVALALQEAGWWLRADIVWHKESAMPESVRDRPTRCHESLFLLAKSDRYYYDAAAVAEPCVSIGRSSGNKTRKVAMEGDRARTNSHLGSSVPWTDESGTRNRRSVWVINPKPYKGAHFAVMPPALVEPCVLAGCPPGGVVLDPFAGSGTVGEVALKLGRSAILCELNPAYVELIRQRVGLFAESS